MTQFNKASREGFLNSVADLQTEENYNAGSPYQVSQLTPGDSFIDFKEVQQIIPLSKSRYYALMKEGKVPRSVKIGDHRACWLLSECLAYANQKIQERNARTK